MRTSYNRGTPQKAVNQVTKKPQGREKRVEKSQEKAIERASDRSRVKPEAISAKREDVVTFVNTEGMSDWEKIFSGGYSVEEIPEYYRICREVDDYYYYSSEMDDGNACYLDNQGIEDDEYDPDEEEDDNDEEENADNPKKSKRSILIISGVVVVVFCLFVWFLVTFVMGKLNLNKPVDLAYMQEEVNNLYTTEDKLDVRDAVTQNTLDKLKKSLNSVEGISKEERDGILNELNTVGFYIADMDVLDGIDSDSYDLNESSMSEDIVKVSESAKGYSVPGLAITVSTKIQNINEDVKYFVSLRDDLSSVTDYKNFDENGYKEKIKEVTHKPNREELNDMYDTLVSAKRDAEEVEKLKAQQDEESKKQAEELQKKTEEELQSAREELDKYKTQSADLLESIKNSLSKDETANAEESNLSEEESLEDSINE